MPEHSINAIAKLGSMATLAALRTEAFSLFKSLGYSGFACSSLPFRPDSKSHRFLHAGWPVEWIRIYVGRQYYLVDPVLSYAKSAAHAFTIREVPIPEDRPEALELLAENRRFGITFAMGIPVQTAGAIKGLALLAGNDEKSEQEVLSIAKEAATALFSRLCELQPLPKNLLTSREIEMLQSAAQGMTTSEIARLYKISDRTVNTHFEHATQKLGTSNRLQTVVHAMRQGLI